jgi:propanol-preferring alcohol dehydrogenase
MGRTVNGGFAEYMAAPAENAIEVPENVSDEVASIIPCSVSTAYHTVRRANFGLGQRVAIFGIGGLGLNAVQFSQLVGADVIAVDVVDEKLEIARSFGATHCLNAKRMDPVTGIKELTEGKGGRGAGVCRFPGNLSGLHRQRKTGREGHCGGYHPEPLKVNSLRLMLDEVTITGAHVANRSDIREIVSLLGRKFDLKGW